jgi:hypothetical protein
LYLLYLARFALKILCIGTNNPTKHSAEEEVDKHKLFSYFSLGKSKDDGMLTGVDTNFTFTL